MIRWTLIACIALIVIGLGFRSWFWSLCALIITTAVADHQEFRDSLFGVTGLKPWNVLCAIVILQWAMQRHRDGLHGGLPRSLVVGLFCFIIAIEWGALTAFYDLGHMEGIYPLSS